jgi:hypothetical protein
MTQVEQGGRFAEQGRRYFDLTWESAEYDVRASKLDKLEQHTAPKGPRGPVRSDEVFGDDAGDLDQNAGGRPMILVASATTPVRDTLHQVTERLLATGRCFIRAEQFVVVHNDMITPILSSPELAGLLNEYVEFFYVDEDGGEYKPLTPAYANTWLNQRAERSRLPVIRLFTRNPVYTDDWRLVVPGYDVPSGIYYAGPAVEPREDTEHFDALLHDFCFKTPADRANYIVFHGRKRVRNRERLTVYTSQQSSRQHC